MVSRHFDVCVNGIVMLFTSIGVRGRFDSTECPFSYDVSF